MVSEALIDVGIVNFPRRSQRVGTLSQAFIQMQEVGDQLPIKNKSKRLHCIQCARTHKR